MSKRQLFAAANVCVSTFPPLVGFYGIWPTFAQWLPQDPARAFLLGFALGLAFSVLGIIFAISTSPGEQK